MLSKVCLSAWYPPAPTPAQVAEISQLLLWFKAIKVVSGGTE